ncbi:MAG: Ig-like domain repeat protein [Gemmataceae bacterium]|nr:Ig-like domain repeat protein [Gemmataceae bacterium]
MGSETTRSGDQALVVRRFNSNGTQDLTYGSSETLTYPGPSTYLSNTYYSLGQNGTPDKLRVASTSSFGAIGDQGRLEISNGYSYAQYTYAHYTIMSETEFTLDHVTGGRTGVANDQVKKIQEMPAENDWSDLIQIVGAVEDLSNNRIVVAAQASQTIVLAGFRLDNGQLDTSFGVNGSITTPLPQHVDYYHPGTTTVSANATALAIDLADGVPSHVSIFVVGTYYTPHVVPQELGGDGVTPVSNAAPYYTDFAVWQFDSTGHVLSSDPTNQSYGPRGIAGGLHDNNFWSIPFASPLYQPDYEDNTEGSYAEARAVTALGDGTIAVVGQAASPSRAQEFAVARVAEDTGAVLFHRTTSFFDEKGVIGAATAVTVAHGISGQPQILVAGDAGYFRDIALAKFNLDGTMVADFGQNGLALSPIVAFAPTAVVVQPDTDQIVVLGNSIGNGSVLARFNADGTVDPNFGPGGKGYVANVTGSPLALRAVNVSGLANLELIVATYGYSPTLYSPVANLSLYTADNSASESFAAGLGGPYTAIQYHSVTLSVSVTGILPGPTAYFWDLNGDGDYRYLVSATPIVVVPGDLLDYLDSVDYRYGAPKTFHVGVAVTSKGKTVFSSTELTITPLQGFLQNAINNDVTFAPISLDIDSQLGANMLLGLFSPWNTYFPLYNQAYVPSAPNTRIQIQISASPALDFNEAWISVPVGLALRIRGGQWHGGSPALTLVSGDFSVSDAIFDNPTDAPAILVTGGTLVIRNSTIDQSAGNGHAAVSLTGGSVDLGTESDPGGNTIYVSGSDVFLSNLSGAPVSNVGNSYLNNGIPVAVPQVVNSQYTVGENLVLAVAGPGLLLSAVDPAGGPLTAVLVNGATNGTLTLNADGSFVYTPDVGFVGIDTFSYQARAVDGTLSAVATVSLRTIALATQTLTFDPLAPVILNGSPIVLSATASSGLPVTFRVLSGPGTVNNNALTLSGAGVVLVEARQDGNEAYAPASPVVQTLLVSAPTITLHPGSGEIRDFPLASGAAPGGAAVGPDGSFWFSEYGKGYQVAKMSPAGILTEFKDANGKSIVGGPPIIDQDGHVWFVNAVGGDIFAAQGGEGITEMAQDGTILRHFSIPSPGGNRENFILTANPVDGNIWFTDPYEAAVVGRLKPDGSVSYFPITMPGGDAAANIIADPNTGDLWFSGVYSDQLGQLVLSTIDSLGGPTIHYFSTPYNSPRGLTLGPDGNVWATEATNGYSNAIIRLNPATGAVSTFAVGLSVNGGASALAVGPDGTLWFTEPNVGKIGRITTDGVITEREGSATSIAANSSSVWFADYYGGKISVIDLGQVPLADARAGTPYTQSITPSGGTAPYTFVIEGGSLPAGLSLVGSTISGTAREAGTFEFTIIASDANGFSGSQSYSLTVAPPHIQLQPDSSTAFREYTLPAPNLGPSGYTTGPNGSFWITEHNRGFQIAKVGPDGVVTEISGAFGGNPAVDENGNIWFANNQNGDTITRMDPDGSNRQTFRIPLPNANRGDFNLAPSPRNGMVWFTDAYEGNFVGRLDSNTGVVTWYTLPDSFGSYGAADIVVDATGNVWFDGVSVSQIAMIPTDDPDPIDPSNIRVFSTPGGTRGLTIGPDGNLWVTASDTNQIVRMTPDGFVSAFDIPTANSGPYGMTVGPDGALWFTEVTANQLGRITTNGFVSEFAIPTSGRNIGIAGSADGIWFTGYDTGLIGKFLAVPNIPLPDGRAGDEYTQTFAASGGTAGYAFAITAGALPAGLGLSSAGLGLSSAGALSGTPTVAGTFTFTVSVTDATAGTGPFTTSQGYSLTIAPSADAGGPYSMVEGSSLTLDASASVAATGSGVQVTYTWSINGVDNAATGANPTFSWTQLQALGITDEGDSIPISVTVDDGDGLQDTATSSLTITDAPLTATSVTVSAIAGQQFDGVVAHFSDANAYAGIEDFGSGFLGGFRGGFLGGSGPGFGLQNPGQPGGNIQPPQMGGGGIGSVTIDWGDGNTSLGTVVIDPDGGFDVLGSNTYLHAGAFTVQVQITDRGGSTASAASTAVVAPAPTTTVLAGPAAAIDFGDAASFTATVTGAPGLDTPTGTVEFFDGSIDLGSGTLVDGTATFSTSTLSVGSHAITAIYAGNGDFGNSASGLLSQTVHYNTGLTILASLEGTNGGEPLGGLVEDSSGNLFGTAYYGGASNLGTVFELPAGSRTIIPLFSFAGLNGAHPSGGLVLDENGNIFGTTIQGGASYTGTNIYGYADGFGTVFELSPTNEGGYSFTTLHSFNGTDGSAPAGLISDSAGNLFGATTGGGEGNNGTIFRVAKDTGAVTMVAAFNGTNGAGPSGLILDSQGNLFGTASTSIAGFGPFEIFEVPAGTGAIARLATFSASGGPPRGLVADASGNVFGAIPYGGANRYGSLFELATDGTVTMFGTFDAATGVGPGHMTIDQGGNLFGTTSDSGPGLGGGTVFEVVGGTRAITTLAAFNFPGGPSIGPSTNLVLDGDGNLFGATYGGGTTGLSYGTLFVVSPAPIASITATVNSIPVSGSGTFTVTRTKSVGTLQVTLAVDAGSTVPAGYSLSGDAVSFDAVAGLVTVNFADGVSAVPIYYTPAGAEGSARVLQLDLQSNPDYLVNAGNASAAIHVLADTTTTFVSTLSPSVYGQIVTFTATVSTTAGVTVPHGTVEFFDGTTDLGGSAVDSTGRAQLALQSLAGGSHSIRAVYEGDGLDFNPSVSAFFAQTVNQASSTTVVSSSTPTSDNGEAITFTATVAPAGGYGSPSGSVRFFDGATLIGTASVDVFGVATLSSSGLAAGVHTQITAQYSGDGNFVASTSSAFTQTVRRQTSTTVSSSLATSVTGQQVTLTATVTPRTGMPSPAGGTVTFFDGTTPIGTANLGNNGKANLSYRPSPVGLHTITAIYNGDAFYMVSTSGVFAQTVNPDATAATLTLSSATTVVGQALTLTAKITASAPGSGTPTGTVTFYDGANVLGTAIIGANGNARLTLTDGLPLGSRSLTASYAGDGNYLASASSAQAETVNQAATTTKLVNLTTGALVYGETITLSATVTVNAPGSGQPTGTVTFYDNGVIVGPTSGVSATNGVATLAVVPSGVGSHTFTASYSGDANDAASSGTLTKTIAQAASNVSLSSSASPSVYGQAVTFTATVAATAPGAGIPTGSVTFTDTTAGVTTTLGTVNVDGNGIATLTTSAPLSRAGHTIKAVYSGDANFKTSNKSVTQTVGKASVSLTAAPQTARVNTPVSLSALVQAIVVDPAVPSANLPTGTVTFKDTTTNKSLGTATLDSSGMALLSNVNFKVLGHHSIAVTYNGDSNYLAFSITLDVNVTA